jgi:hypothetical protein
MNKRVPNIDLNFNLNGPDFVGPLFGNIVERNTLCFIIIQVLLMFIVVLSIVASGSLTLNIYRGI